MNFLLSITKWQYGLLKRSAEFILSIPGMIAAGISSICAVIASLFSKFTFWTDITDFITEAATYVEYIIPSGTTADFLLGFFAVDRFAAIASALFGATVGVTLAIFVTMFLSIVVLLPTIYGIKAAIRAISILSAGFVKP